MAFRKPCSLAIVAVATLLSQIALGSFSYAQGPAPEAPVASASVQPVSTFVTAPRTPEYPHKFWDRQNKTLFLITAGLNGADFAVTRANLQSGGRELNPMVRIFGRSDAGLAINFAGNTAAAVAVSYLFHRTGHHKLERLSSMMTIGASAGAVSYGLATR
ncbi:MAG TPA: hypothetical protein VMU05_04405 [Dongiaceae bacterium]|nr:hypothetical protein [Dongiaceae bacterium]